MRVINHNWSVTKQRPVDDTGIRIIVKINTDKNEKQFVSKMKKVNVMLKRARFNRWKTVYLYEKLMQVEHKDGHPKGRLGVV